MSDCKLREAGGKGHAKLFKAIEESIEYSEKYGDLLDMQNNLRLMIKDRILHNSHFDELSLKLYKEIRGVSLESEISTEVQKLKWELEDAQETVKYLKDCIKEKEDVLNKF